jgi:hypothetical protein
MGDNGLPAEAFDKDKLWNAVNVINEYRPFDEKDIEVLLALNNEYIPDKYKCKQGTRNIMTIIYLTLDLHYGDDSFQKMKDVGVPCLKCVIQDRWNELSPILSEFYNELDPEFMFDYRNDQHLTLMNVEIIQNNTENKNDIIELWNEDPSEGRTLISIVFTLLFKRNHWHLAPMLDPKKCPKTKKVYDLFLKSFLDCYRNKISATRFEELQTVITDEAKDHFVSWEVKSIMQQIFGVNEARSLLAEIFYKLN